jgi:hypothetical protein
MAHPEADTILALEQRRYQAMIDVDVETLEELCSDELIYTHSNGTQDTKESWIRKLTEGYFDYRWAEHPVEKVVISGDAAVVYGRMRAEVLVQGESRKLNSLVLVVWLAEPGGWKFVAYQPTPVPA